MLRDKKSVPYSLLLDADGVITNPWTREIEKEVLHKISVFLKNSVPIFVITGRTTHWIKNNVENLLINRLQKDGLPLSLLHNFIMMGEMGVFVEIFDETGKKQILPPYDEVLNIPDRVRMKIYKIAQDEFSDTMFEGDQYQTILAPQMKYGLTEKLIEKYKGDQEKFKKKVKDSIPPEFDIKFSTTAIEIKDKRHGKGIGAKRALEILRQRKLTPSRIYAIGDSPLDIDMAKVINESGISVEFIFVGDVKRKSEVEQLRGGYQFPIHYTKSHYNEGAKEFLKNLVSKQ